MACQSLCPVCKKEVHSRPGHAPFPFCSFRCRSVDLGRWAGEEYRLPDRSRDEQEDEVPPPEGERSSGQE